jgi:hypothetical protein
MAWLRPDAGLPRVPMPWILFLPIVADTFILGWKRKVASGPELSGARTYWRYAVLGVALAVVLMLSPLKVANFIYFQF